jgi:hypothetical protein
MAHQYYVWSIMDQAMDVYKYMDVYRSTDVYISMDVYKYKDVTERP